MVLAPRRGGRRGLSREAGFPEKDRDSTHRVGGDSAARDDAEGDPDKARFGRLIEG